MTAVVEPRPCALRSRWLRPRRLRDRRRSDIVTCPAALLSPSAPSAGQLRANCKTCPLRQQCTTAKAGQVIVLHPHHRHLVAAGLRRRPRTSTPLPRLRRWSTWPGLAHPGRETKAPLPGVERNQLSSSHRCAAVNLRRLINLGLIRAEGTWAIACDVLRLGANAVRALSTPRTPGRRR